MKKTISLVVAALLIIFSFPMSFQAAVEDFDIYNGVLLSYKGNSSSVTIPSEVYYIADSAFEDNSKIASVNLNNVKIIGNKAFYNCTSLSSVTNGSDVKSCGAYAFFNTPFQANNKDTNLILGTVLLSSRAEGSVTISTSVTSIAPYCFSGNTGITSVTVGDNVSEIGEGAFYNCSSLMNVSVSDQVSYIGAFAFEGTKWLFTREGEFVTLGADILIKANTTTEETKIPDGVRQIGAGAFYKNNKVRVVSVPSTVTAIGKRAFAECTALEEISLPAGLVMLDDEAFYNCKALKSAEIPPSVSLLGDSVYLGCTGLKRASVLTDADVSSGLFANCSSLEAVYIASETRRIGNYAFYNCSGLSEISVPDTVYIMSSTAFSGCNSLSVFCNSDTYISSQCELLGISYYQIGDANLDSKVNVRDATHIQKATADLLSLSFSSVLRGDVDMNSVVNVRDATQIQKIVAGIV